MNLRELKVATDQFALSEKMPVLFIGHGHPMNALLDNNFTRTLQQIGQTLPKPNAVLMISAHWQTKGTYVSTNAHPRAIYDFGRFDDRLFEMKYEPPGHPQMAKELIKSVTYTKVLEDNNMGLDHGAWTVLQYIYPKADVPVFEMSIDYTQPTAFHYQLGHALRQLREKGVLIISSGNIVHNLYAADFYNMDAKPFEWAIAFDEVVKEKINAGDHQSLIDYHKMGLAASYAVPTNDHYLPMMYTLGLLDKAEAVKHLFEGYQNASVSMRCFSSVK